MDRERLFQLAYEADLKRRRDQDKRARKKAPDLAALLRLLVSTQKNHDDAAFRFYLGEAEVTVNYIDTGEKPREPESE